MGQVAKALRSGVTPDQFKSLQELLSSEVTEKAVVVKN